MRIISKFHDYYDIGMGLGQDRSVVFVRDKEERTEAPASMQLTGRVERRSQNGVDAFCYPFAIAFCGKIYRGYNVKIYNFGYSYKDPYAPHSSNRHCYSLDELEGYLNANCVLLDDYQGRYSRWPSKGKALKDFLSKQGDASSESWFIERKISIMVQDSEWRDDPYSPHGRQNNIVVNPQLKRYEFFRIFNAYQAYQELSMFVGGILPGSDADMAAVSDNDRIAQRGFDKWSFRKMSTKPK